MFSCFNRHEAAGEAALLPLLGAEVLLSYSTPNSMAHALPLELIATADVPARASPSADADADADALAELAARAAASTALEAGGCERARCRHSCRERWLTGSSRASAAALRAPLRSVARHSGGRKTYSPRRRNSVR